MSEKICYDNPDICEDSIEALSSIITNQFRKYLEHGSNYRHYYFPIQSIDGVKCKLHFKIVKTETGVFDFVFTIQSRNISQCKPTDYLILFRTVSTFEVKEWNLTNCIEESEQHGLRMLCVRLLKIMKYGKLSVNGEISCIDDVDASELMLNNCIKTKFPNIEVEPIEECCVCTNQTYTKTHCQHSLCYRCWFNIKETNYKFISCPLCRKNIIDKYVEEYDSAHECNEADSDTD
jgi:hypothetical protein